MQSKLTHENVSWQGNRAYIGQRQVGWIAHSLTHDKTFISPRKRAEHYFRNYEGYGISTELLIELYNRNVAYIDLIIDQKQLAKSSMTAWMKHGVPYKHPNFEEQIILSEYYMMTEELP